MTVEYYNTEFNNAWLGTQANKYIYHIILLIGYFGGPEKGRVFRWVVVGQKELNLRIRTGYVPAS